MRSTKFRRARCLRDSRTRSAAMAAAPATKFARAPAPPRSQPALQKIKSQGTHASCCGCDLLFSGITFQSDRQLRGVLCDLGAVEIARPRQFQLKNFANPAR